MALTDVSETDFLVVVYHLIIDVRSQCEDLRAHVLDHCANIPVYMILHSRVALDDQAV